MSNTQALYIAFGGCQVAVSAKNPEVIATLRQWFSAMLVLEDSCIVAYFEVSGDREQYDLLKCGKAIHLNLTQLQLLITLKYEVIMALIRARSDLLWFHAGAVANGGGVVLLPAQAGGGKSTLVTKLVAQGWQYLSDDVVPLDLKTVKVFPVPQTPRVREQIEEKLPPNKLFKLNKTDVEIVSERLCQQAMPIQAIVFPTYDVDVATELALVSPGNTVLELLRNCVNFTEHKHRAMDCLTNLVQQVPAAKLLYHNSDRAIAILIDWYKKQFNEQNSSTARD